MNSSAERDAQVQGRVREHLRAGESLRAAVWVSRADAGATARMTRADVSPFRFRKLEPVAPRGVHGSPGSLAAGLDQHIRIVTEPRILALTDRRLLVLARRPGSWRDLFRPAAGALRLCWECPRADLASTSEQGGRLRLAFTDGSAVTLLTPAGSVQPFLAG